jgi:hypothetical protein
VLVPPGGYLAPDEADVHPDWGSSFAVDATAFGETLLPLFIPSAAAAWTAFGARSAAHQERTLWDLGLVGVGPAAFSGLYGALDSTVARRGAELAACDTVRFLAGNGGDVSGWAAVLPPFLAAPATPTFNTRYAGCGPDLAAALGGELAGLADAATAGSAARLLYLMSFDYGAAASFDAVGRVASAGPSLQLRDQAVARLSLQARGLQPYQPVDAGDAPGWRTFFRARLAEATSATRFTPTWRALVALLDVDALPVLAPRLHAVPLIASAQRQAVCDAHALALATRPAAWDDFRAAAQPWTTLAPEAAAVLADPAGCAAPQKAARATPRRAADDPIDAPARLRLRAASADR